MSDGPSQRPSVAVLGAGAMGRSLLSGLLAAGWEVEDLSAAVRRPERVSDVREAVGCFVTTAPVEAVAGRRVVVLAAKPRDLGTLIQQIASEVSKDQVVVSVAAGVRTAAIEQLLPGVPVIRAMPNTPALVKEGVTGIAAGTHADGEAVAAARAVLSAVGEVRQFDETVMDAVTAISGTGPAYVFLLAEALVEAAIREGLSRDLAEILVFHTIRGAGHLLTDTGKSPADLRGQVTSPGGTTAAAMHVLEERGFRALVEDAVRAAAERSQQLGSS